MKEQIEKEKVTIDKTITEIMSYTAALRKVKQDFDSNYHTIMEGYNELLETLQKQSVSLNIRLQNFKEEEK